MSIDPVFLLLVLDLAGVLVFAVDGGLTARAATRLDIVGVVSLGMITALGGGVIRDILLPDLPPAALRDWRYLAVALVGGLVAYAASERVHRTTARPIKVLDAAGLSLFAVTGASKALAFGLGPFPAALVGMIAAVGGGTLRDMMVGKVPGILTGGLYAIPALTGAGIVVVSAAVGAESHLVLPAAALVVFTVRMLGLHFDLEPPSAPAPPTT
ncbi:MAG: TRIC cation channel family protein [Propionibacteriaceae bacterium]|nr:TRIC cation channel family protein [Propionibacteriaceae bacterium]